MSFASHHMLIHSNVPVGMIECLTGRIACVTGILDGVHEECDGLWMVFMRGLSCKSPSCAEVLVWASFTLSSSGSLMCTFQDIVLYLSLAINSAGKGSEKMVFFQLSLMSRSLIMPM